MPFQKGNTHGRGKQKLTLEAEARRAIFNELVAKEWEPIVKDLIKKEKKYISDQFIGKSKETIELKEEITLKIDV